MKKLLLAIALIVGVTTLGYSQESNDLTVKAQSKTELVKSKQSGKYTFEMPSSMTSESVAEKAKYYTMYITVEFNNDSKVATVQTVNDEVISSKVIGRFLVNCGVQNVEIDGSSITIQEFSEHYL